MKKICICLVLCLFIASIQLVVYADSGISQTYSQTSGTETQEYIPNEVIVLTNCFLDLSDYTNSPSDFFGVPIVKIDKLFHAETEEEIEKHVAAIGELFTYCVTVDSSISVGLAVNILSNNDNVVVAQPNYVVHAVDVENNITNEASTRNSTITQWAHTYLNMSSVWNKGFSGSSSFTVAILDSGYVAHTDLEDNLNMLLAWDVIDEDEDVTPANDHGNFVAGIIGADYNDGGIDGICKSVDMIPIKICPDGSTMTTSKNLLLGVDDAINNEAKVINYSYEMRTIEPTLRTIINSAKVLFVTTAGNNSMDMANDAGALHKLHDDPYWIVVGSSTVNETKASHSNYSSTYCDLFAPGEGIYSTTRIGHASSNGTSYAAPHVTAACALIMSEATHLTPLQVKNLILDNVKEISGFDNYCVSGGILNISGAIDALYNENRGQYGSYTKGDINNNGGIDSNDYLLAQKIYMNTYTPTSAQINACDVNNNGSIDSRDYLLIKKYYQKTYYFPPV